MSCLKLLLFPISEYEFPVVWLSYHRRRSGNKGNLLGIGLPFDIVLCYNKEIKEEIT